MKAASKFLAGSLVGLAIILPVPALPGAASKDAQVTQIIREVNLLPANADPRAAALNDHVTEETGVRTGGDSRSELTFADLTITRLGANTIFTFNKSGRTANVDSGSILLRVPKNSGGGSIRSSAVTVAITGTTVIFERSEQGPSRLITLEGSARVSLNTKPKESRKVGPGQLLEVPADATELPMPINIDLDELMRTHPLIVDFRPLPSEPLIRSVAQQQPPPKKNAVPAGPLVSPTPRGPRSTPPPSTPPPNYPSTPPPHYPSTPPPNYPSTPPPKPTPQPTKPPSSNPKPPPTPPPKQTPKSTPRPQTNPKPTPTPSPRPSHSNPKPTPTPPPKASPTPSQGPILLKPSSPKPAAGKTPQFKKKQLAPGSTNPR